MFTLAISCLTTYLDSRTEHSCFLCRTVLYIIVLYLHYQSHPQLGVFLFFLWLSLFILSVAISPLFSSTKLGTYRPMESSFSVISFCLFLLFMGFSRQEYWSGLPFHSPVGHILSEPPTVTHSSWVALHGMAPSFNKLVKAVIHVSSFISFL